MSTFTTFGFFGLGAGRRASARTRNGNTTFFCYYTTTLQCSDGDMIPAELRVYSPRDDVPHPDDTIAFVVAKLFVPLKGTALLDAYSVYAVPGDPASDTYEASIPDMPYPFVYGLGIVRSKWGPLPDGTSKAFIVDVHERVRDEAKPSSVQCVFPGGSPRWQTVPAPNPNSFIYFMGTCARVSTEGGLSINIESIVFNVGPSPGSAGGGGLPPGGGSPGSPGTPTKRRKFNSALSSPAASTSAAASSAFVNPPALHPTLLPNALEPSVPVPAQPFVEVAVQTGEVPSSPLGDNDYVELNAPDGDNISASTTESSTTELSATESPKAKGKRRNRN
ncbi:hypothetical protein B0H21DRAFT_886979 [Amylocystis lapponica]|nr:hypothetical protein B0H21DRAFT_886979 [Amylocystis lapponica]